MSTALIAAFHSVIANPHFAIFANESTVTSSAETVGFLGVPVSSKQIAFHFRESGKT